MKELNFNNIFIKEYKAYNPDINVLPYYTALCALDILRIIEPSIVDDCSGYMYAINNNDVNNTGTSNWSSYASKHHKEIARDTTFKALELIVKLAEPFKNIVNEQLTTIPLPNDVLRTILHENLGDSNVMNTLELSVRNLYLIKQEDKEKEPSAFTVIHYKKVLECFKPILDMCNIRQVSEDKILDYYPSRIIHQIAVGLSCLYRLFYPCDRHYWEDMDDLIEQNVHRNKWIYKKISNIPAISPETVVGIIDNRTFMYPVMTKFRSGFMTVPEKYLFLVYLLLSL